jgi:hypothetical protein
MTFSSQPLVLNQKTTLRNKPEGQKINSHLRENLNDTVTYSRVLFTIELYCTQNSIHNC